MEKRTPGAPLSEAEHQQRVEAAKARWQAVTTAAGAGAVGALAQAGAAKLREGIDRRLYDFFMATLSEKKV
jgi:hypothetical protein